MAKKAAKQKSDFDKLRDKQQVLNRLVREAEQRTNHGPWHTVKEMARVLDIGEEGARKWIHENAPPDAIRHPVQRGAPMYVHARKALDAWREAAKPPPLIPIDGDALMVGPGDSIGLERYRLAKADLAEMERDERRSKLLPLDRVNAIFRAIIIPLKRMRALLVQRFGGEAGTIFDKSIDETESEFKRNISP